MFLKKEKGAGLMRYELLPGEEVDGFTLEVLRQNTPKGVLLLGREQTEEYDHLLLPVADLVPLQEVTSILKKNIASDNVEMAVREVRSSLGRYMIPEEELVLRPEWTWFRPETCEPVFLVLPTPAARELSLSPEDYAYLLERYLAPAGEEGADEAPDAESAKSSARPRRAPKPFLQIAREFWENLD